MSLLVRNDKVTTKYGGGFVESIDGLSGGEEAGGEPLDWFYYVNGIEAPKGAAATNVNPGDHIWWDLHDWSQTDDVPAVVGSFPEPFLNGTEGKRLPVRVECAAAQSAPCRTVIARLRALGVPAAVAAIGSGAEPDALQVVVGPWTAVHGDPSVDEHRKRAARERRLRALRLERPDAHAARRRRAARPRTLDGGRGPDRRDEGRRRRDRVGRHRHRRSGRRSARRRRSTRAPCENHFALAVTSTGAQLPVPGAGG